MRIYFIDGKFCFSKRQIKDAYELSKEEYSLLSDAVKRSENIIISKHGIPTAISILDREKRTKVKDKVIRWPMVK